MLPSFEEEFSVKNFRKQIHWSIDQVGGSGLLLES